MTLCHVLNRTWRKRCVKRKRHRGYHKAQIPYVGRVRATYKATHVILWK